MNTSLESIIIRMEIHALQFTPVLFIGVNRLAIDKYVLGSQFRESKPIIII